MALAPGDINSDKSVNLIDAVLTLKTLAGRNCVPFIYNNADVNADGFISLPEAFLAIKHAAELRNNQ